MNILITGASRGIGAATYALLKSRGHTVVGHSSMGTEELIAGDLRHPGVTRHIWIDALDRLGGRIDVLINNAGIFTAASPETDDDEQWYSGWWETLQVNLYAAADLCRFAVKHFREVGGGRIVNVASRAAWRGDSPQHWHYAASKGAIVAMTKTIARAYAAEGIYAFAVSPGFTVSDMAADYLQSRGGAGIVADIPLGRVAHAEEVAETIRWLATEAPPSATGTNVDVNGASYVR
jgi:NAD(P)-dependent dehydrogenase (short-subunit alcohol dehydrogenase family)